MNNDSPSAGPAKILVHHLNNSRSQRVLWLLEELDVPYDLACYQRDPNTMLGPAGLRKIHPLGKSPVVVADGKVIAETGLIVEYICDRFDAGELAPANIAGVQSVERLRWLYWLHYAEGSAMPPLLLKLVFSRMPDQAPWPIKFVVKMISKRGQQGFIDPQVELHLDYWEATLRKEGWFAGPKFSAADIMMSFPVEAARRYTDFYPRWPHLQAFVEQIHSRSAYRRALERGGHYAFA